MKHNQLANKYCFQSFILFSFARMNKLLSFLLDLYGHYYHRFAVTDVTQIRRFFILLLYHINLLINYI